MKYSINVNKSLIIIRYKSKTQKYLIHNLIWRNNRFKIIYSFDGKILTIHKVKRFKVHLHYNGLSSDSKFGYKLNSFGTKHNVQVSKVKLKKDIFKSSKDELPLNENVQNVIASDKIENKNKDGETQTFTVNYSTIACQINQILKNESGQGDSNQDNSKPNLETVQNYLHQSNKILNGISETIISQNILIENNFKLLNNISNLLLIHKNYEKQKKNPSKLNRSKGGHINVNKNKYLENIKISNNILKHLEGIEKLLGTLKFQSLQNKCEQPDDISHEKIGVDFGTQTVDVISIDKDNYNKKKEHSCCTLL